MTIKQTKSGKWTSFFYVGKDLNGKRIFKRFAHAKKSEVKRLVADYLASHADIGDTENLSYAINMYIANREETCSPSTIVGYRSMERTLKKDYGSFF